jgi:hypothetical protein
MLPTSSPVLAPPAPVPAVRLPTSRWRDPRLVLGLLIVAGSVLLGSWVVASADDAVTVWGVRATMPAGARLSETDLEPRRVRFSDGVDGRYVTDRAQVVGHVLARGVGAGELVPAAAVARATDPPGAQVPLTVEESGLPGTVRPGSVIDVWVAPRDPASGGSRARRVLEEVVVLAVPDSADPLAPATSSTVVVSVEQEVDLGDVLGATAAGRVVAVLRGQR